MLQHQRLTGVVHKSHIGQRLDFTLAKMFPDYSRTCIKTWIRSGLVIINGRVSVIPKEKILGGETVEMQVTLKEEPCWKAQNIPLAIIYEDEDILVINKPCNLVVHTGCGNPDGTILNALLHYFPPIADVPRAGIVHRLDKGTTGLMVVAKTLQAQMHLVESLQARAITREYEAIAIGTMTAGGSVRQSIARHATKRTHMAIRPMGKPAVTHYRIVEHFRSHTHLRLRLETGRTHQIRVHMAHINHPLVGDPLYGGRPKPPKGASAAFKDQLHLFYHQALHAIFLSLFHPITSIEMRWHAPLPKDMAALIAALKEDAALFKVPVS
ncbi:23S rRNA pseudouridine(1911/1915/1917) synthase RluD [secondary endosymbiont of Ctenarytaina eucalypti]|nr:23S rRNA pseudouridine(1911/1915/1917) synthase RluD [secondary endosymbiont of Ctenarytaina eucalypti]